MNDDMNVVVSVKAEMFSGMGMRIPNSTEIPCSVCEEITTLSPSSYTQIQLGAINICMECFPVFLATKGEDFGEVEVKIEMAPGAIEEIREFFEENI